MLAGNQLDALAWEPCIMKHPAHYENPWTDREGDWKKRKSRAASGKPRTNIARPLTVTNIETGEIKYYPSFYRCQEEMSVSHRDLKECVAGRIYKKLYRITLTNA